MNQDNVPLLAYIFVGMTSIVLAYVTLSDKEGISETIETSPSDTTEISAMSNVGLEPERPQESPSAPDQELLSDQALQTAPDQALEIPTVEAEPLQSVPEQPLQAPENPQPQEPPKVEKRGGNKKSKKTKSNIKKSKSKSKKTKSNRKKSN